MGKSGSDRQTLGHYLSALAMMYASTDDEGALERIRYSVNELDVCQQAFDFHGLFAAFPNARKLFHKYIVGISGLKALT